jgi:transcriptional regulator NrdR family protein
MKCIKCKGLTHVLETRGVIRRRECLECKTRFKTEEVVFEEAEKKERAPRTVKTEPSISRTKEKLIARKNARDIIEKRRWDRENEWYGPDNDYLPSKW